MALNGQDMLVAVAIHYYEENLSQKEIADRYRISRATVSNLLKRCRNEGIVEIRIKKTPSLSFILQHELESVLDMDKVIVIPSEEEEVYTRIQVGQAAADFIATLLRENLRIGISYGTSLFETVNQLHPRKQYLNSEVIQLLGAAGSINPKFDGVELARTLAEKLGGTYRTVQAPLIVQSAEVKKLLLNEPGIAEVLQKGRSVDIAVVGISSNNPDISGLVRAGFISREESADVYSSGAVGNICGLHFDRNGNVLHISLNDRTIGISAEELLRIPIRVGVASGIKKSDAILGAMQGGLVNTLITDSDAALKVLSELKNKE